MAEKKVIDLEVKSNIQKTINELNSLETNLEDVRDEAGKTSKSIDDVAGNGGAIAILDQLTGGLASQFKNAYESTKLFNLSLKGTKSALIATGIGALVVALGAIVAYWDDIVEFVNGTNKALQKQNELLKENTAFLDSRLKTVEAEKKSLEAQGKSTKEITELQNTLLTQKRELLKLQLINLETQLKEEESVVKKVSLWEKIKVSALTAAGLYKEAANATAESVIGNDEERKSINDKKIAIEQLKTSLAELTLAQTELNKPKETGADGKREKVTGIGGVLTAEEQQAENEKRAEFFAQVFELEANNKQALIDLNKNSLDQIGKDQSIANAKSLENDKEISEAKILIAQKESEAKTAAANSYMDALGAVSQLVGKETAAGKAIAIASTIISTYSNASKARASQLAIPTPDAPIRAAIAMGVEIAAGLANIKAITSVKVPYSGGSGGSGGVNIPSSRTAQTPSFNIVGQSGTNQLAEAIGTQESKPIKAYVTSNDVTTAQGLDRNIVQGATIG